MSMNLANLHLDTSSLSRAILRSCWLIILLYVLATGSYLFISDYNRSTFLTEAILLPTFKMVFVCGCLELCVRKGYRWVEFAVIAGVNMMIGIMMVSLYTLPMIAYLLIFPILISLFYYQQRIIYFSLLQGLLTISILYMTSFHLRDGLKTSSFILIIAMLIGTAMIIINLRNRTFALVREFVGITQEKQELQTKNIMMERINRIDPATELYNHRSFYEHLDSILSLQSTHSLNVHLVLLDIDNFKQVNDSFGHAVGDFIIQFVAKVIKDHMEPDDFAARYGGEEFAILCVDKETEQLHEQIERIRRALMTKEHNELTYKHITASFGIQKLHLGMSKEDLFHGADSALYTAKKSGKNRIVIG